jgi:hypothetical protein
MPIQPVVENNKYMEETGFFAATGGYHGEMDFE